MMRETIYNGLNYYNNNNNNSIHNEILIELRSRLSYLGQVYDFRKGDGTEFGEPSRLVLLRDSSQIIPRGQVGVVTKITSTVGDSRRFENCFGVIKYNLFYGIRHGYQVIDRCCSNDVVDVLSLLEHLVKEKTATDTNLELDNATDDLNRLLVGVYINTYKSKKKKLKESYPTKFDISKSQWTLPSTYYYVLDLQESFKSRVLSFQFPVLFDDKLHINVIVQVRQNLSTNEITFHVAKCEWFLEEGDNTSYVVTKLYPKETLCKNKYEVLKEVDKFFEQDQDRIDIILDKIKIHDKH